MVNLVHSLPEDSRSNAQGWPLLKTKPPAGCLLPQLLSLLKAITERLSGPEDKWELQRGMAWRKPQLLTHLLGDWAGSSYFGTQFFSLETRMTVIADLTVLWN